MNPLNSLGSLLHPPGNAASTNNVADEFTSFSTRAPPTQHIVHNAQRLTPGKDKTVDRQRSACMCGHLQHETEKTESINSIILVNAAISSSTFCSFNCSSLTLMVSESRTPLVCPPQVVFF